MQNRYLYTETNEGMKFIIKFFVHSFAPQCLTTARIMFFAEGDSPEHGRSYKMKFDFFIAQDMTPSI